MQDIAANKESRPVCNTAIQAMLFGERCIASPPPAELAATANFLALALDTARAPYV